MIEPEVLFRNFHLAWRQPLGRFSGVPVRDRFQGLLASRLRGNARRPSLREIAGDILAPSHEALLLRKT
jgi:hypothetical protein